MKKKDFINALSEKTSLSLEDAKKVNGVLEKNMLIGRKNKIKIIDGIKDILNVSDLDAEKIYEEAVEIIAIEVKDKVIHPFKSLD